MGERDEVRPWREASDPCSIRVETPFSPKRSGNSTASIFSTNASLTARYALKVIGIRYWDGRHNNWYAGTRDTPWPIFG